MRVYISLGETDTLEEAQFCSGISQNCYPGLNQALIHIDNLASIVTCHHEQGVTRTALMNQCQRALKQFFPSAVQGFFPPDIGRHLWP